MLIKVLLDIRTLTLLRSAIAGNPSCPPLEYVKELITHQLAVKSQGSESWTTHVRKLLEKYKLPPASELLEYTPGKKEWKAAVKRAVHEKWSEDLCAEAMSMSTLQYLNIDQCSTDRIHPVWTSLSSTLEVKQASIKAPLLH